MALNTTATPSIEVSHTARVAERTTKVVGEPMSVIRDAASAGCKVNVRDFADFALFWALTSGGALTACDMRGGSRAY